MRILHTEWSDGMGGQEKRVLAECQGLTERGHEVELVCRGHARIRAEAERLGIKVHILPLRRPYDAASILNLYRIIKRGRFDVVNTHSGVDSWVGGIAAKLAGVPLLVRTRHLNIPLRRNILNFVHYLPDFYVTCGENMRKCLITDCGFPSNKVVSIPTGVDAGFLNIKRDNAGKLKFGLSLENRVVSNVGILRRVKGHEVTLKSVKAVIDEVPETRFIIAGDGPLYDRLNNIIMDLEIEKYVIMTGYVQDVSEIYSISDVLVLSSWSEGLPQSILQSMAAGVPVVATRVGGVPEVVIDGKTGICVDPGDHGSLAGGIVRMLQQPDLVSSITQSARKLVIEKYLLDGMISETERLYGGLLARKNKNSA